MSNGGSGGSGDSGSGVYQREMSMEEGTLQLAQTLARQSLDEDESAEAADGSPTPLRKNPNTQQRLEGKLQGFRYVIHIDKVKGAVLVFMSENRI